MKHLYTPADTPGWVIPMTGTPWVLLMMGFMCLTTCSAVIVYSRWRNCTTTNTNSSIFIPHSNHDKKASVPSIWFYSYMHVYKFVAIIYSLFIFLTTTFYNTEKRWCTTDWYFMLKVWWSWRSSWSSWLCHNERHSI